MVTRESLIGYAQSFVSFLLDSGIGVNVHKVILFGSVARGDFSSESDIDLFVDVEGKYISDVEKVFRLFLHSQSERMWRLKGFQQEISLKAGVLTEWGLYREVISSGVLLYGKYVEVPEGVRFYALFVLTKVVRKKVSTQVKLWRELYGYTQKVGKKRYVKKGIVEQEGGSKLANSVFIVPMEMRRKVMIVLRREKVEYKLFELWSDRF